MARWSGAVTNGGRLAVSTVAALGGARGLGATFSNRSDMYVADASPAALEELPRCDSDSTRTASRSRRPRPMISSPGWPQREQVGRSYRSAGSDRGYEVRAGARLEQRQRQVRRLGADQRRSARASRSVGPHPRPSSGTNGSLDVVDRRLVSDRDTGLANGSQRVDDARLGPQTIPSGMSGVEYYDDSSRRPPPTSGRDRASPLRREWRARRFSSLSSWRSFPAASCAPTRSSTTSARPTARCSSIRRIRSSSRSPSRSCADGIAVEVTTSSDACRSGLRRRRSIRADPTRVVVDLGPMTNGTYQIRVAVVDREDLHQVVARMSFAVGEEAPAREPAHRGIARTDGDDRALDVRRRACAPVRGDGHEDEAASRADRSTESTSDPGTDRWAFSSWSAGSARSRLGWSCSTAERWTMWSGWLVRPTPNGWSSSASHWDVSP